jgi:hypothetical protein
MGCVQPGTRRGTFLQMIGYAETTPPRMLRIVPFGDFHISLRLNSCTRASSGVIVAHLTPTPWRLIASAASPPSRPSPVGVAVLDAEISNSRGQDRDRVDQLVLDGVPDDPGHFVARRARTTGFATLISAIWRYPFVSGGNGLRGERAQVRRLL